MKLDADNNSSLQKTLKLQIGLIVFGIGFTIAVLFMIFSFRWENQDFQDSIAFQKKHLTDTFTQQLWLLDFDTIHKLSELAVNSSDINGIRVYDGNKNIVVEIGVFQENATTRIIREALHYNENDLVGHIDISFINTTWKRHQWTILLVGCSIIVLTVVSSFILISFLLKRHLAIPLDNLQKSMLAFTAGEFTPTNPKGQKAEIQNIIDCFNQMASALSNREKSKQIAEKALRESEEKYRSMMESMDDAAYICSPEYRIQYMNPAMERMLGYNAVGGYCYRAIYGRTQKCTECFYDKVKQGKTIKEDIFHEKNNRTYHISTSPINYPGAPVSMLAVFRDITDIKHMEGMVEQAQKTEAIGTLAGGIAHDFNNILFPILGYSEMLLDDIPDDDDLKPSVKSIYTGALRAKELVQQILTFSRQEESKMTLMKIQPILKEALKMIRSTVPATIDIQADIDPKCNVVKADPTQIHQIIMNLTTNAYHAVEEKGGTIKVALKQVKLETEDLINSEIGPGLYACLTVRDDGMGMGNELIEKIFNPFFTTKEEGKGTGMGLSVVHGIVNKIQGAIDVSSRLGKGTTFHIYLPIDESCLVENNEAEKAQSIIGGSEHILLVDDDKGIVEMGALVLKRLGYKVTPSSNSLEALELYRTNPDLFDLVITDYAMPKMAGDKLASNMMAIRPDIPIILNTGFSDKITPEKVSMIGIKAILMKPMVKRELAQTIRSVLEH